MTTTLWELMILWSLTKQTTKKQLKQSKMSQIQNLQFKAFKFEAGGGNTYEGENVASKPKTSNWKGK